LVLCFTFVLFCGKHQNDEPLEYNWITRNKSRDFANLAKYQTEFQPGAIRFDVGQRSQLHLMPMATAALQQILDWKVESIYQTLSAWNTEITKEMVKIGCDVAPPRNRGGHMLGIRFDETIIKGEKIIETLKTKNVYVSIRGNSIRVSPHLHVNENDINIFIKAMTDLLKPNFK
ncbi:aminotransferase class V, partial [Reticulomyxa filosa]